MGLELLLLPLSLLTLLAVIAGFVLAEGLRKSDERTWLACWATYARARRLALVEGVLRGDGHEIATVWVRGRVHTRASIVPEVPLLLDLTVVHGRTGPVPTGDEAFDSAFGIRATPITMADRVLSPELRTRLQAFHLGQDLRFRYARGRFTLLWPGAEQSHARLDEARAILRAALATTSSTSSTSSTRVECSALCLT